MSMYDAIAAAIGPMQERAESLMTDPCMIVRPGAAATDPDTGEVTNPTTPVYDGPAKLTTYEPYEQTPDVGSSTPTLQRYSLHVPVTAGPFEVGDVATILGRRFRIAGPHGKTWQTARRLLVDEITTAQGA
jgi:hypothetical protein